VADLFTAAKRHGFNESISVTIEAKRIGDLITHHSYKAPIPFARAWRLSTRK
jgi:hypothetical protein